MDPGSLSRNAVWVSATNLIHSGCGVYKWRERCRGNVCSGYMESKDTLEKTDQKLTWKSYNESIIINMRDMFPGLIVCQNKKNHLSVDPNTLAIVHQLFQRPLRTLRMFWRKILIFPNYNVISELRRARSRTLTTKTISTTTTAITTVTSKPITSMTTTTTQRMMESERDYRGES